MSSTNELIDRINSVTQESLQHDANARAKLLAAAQSLCIRLETPWDFVQRVTWQEPSFLMCLKIADDIGLFEHVGAEGSPAKSVETLAATTSVDPVLLKRVARHLAARHVLTTASPRDLPSGPPPSSLGFYGATHISAALATREGSSGIRQTVNNYYPNFLAMPALLRERGYRSPTDNRDGPFQRRHGLIGKTSFECMQRPEFADLAADFNLLMKFTTQGRRSFLDVCDVGGLLEARPFDREQARGAGGGGEDDGGYLFVDVGGGTGTDARAFRRRFADVPGRVELQELPAVIDAAKRAVEAKAETGSEEAAGGSDAGSISFRPHDFFSEQPVRAPRFFFMGSVLHDWPDADATKILRRLGAAMKPGYSTLLLSENVLVETSISSDGETKAVGCHPHLSAIDLTMMTSLASKERSERDWTELLAGAGLRILKVHTVPSSLKSVLECELAEMES